MERSTMDPSLMWTLLGVLSLPSTMVLYHLSQVSGMRTKRRSQVATFVYWVVTMGYMVVRYYLARDSRIMLLGAGLVILIWIAGLILWIGVNVGEYLRNNQNIR